MFLLVSCMSPGDPIDPQLPSLDLPETAHAACENGPDRIVDLPEGFGDYEREDFTRYTEVVAPNGRAIPIFAQDEISDTQILRSRNLLRFYLQDVPGSTWGEDKSDVADAMADNAAVLVLVNGHHTGRNEPNVPAQPLYDEETPVVGHAWFMDNDFEFRDAAFEEIFHLVHDTGIGTYLPGARPDYQADLDAEARLAMEDGRWPATDDRDATQWIEELEREGSLAQEYIASVIDSYYGLWGPWDEADGGMWGIYIAKDRDEVAALDPAGLGLVEDFLSPTLTVEEPVDAEFTGTLELSFDAETPYTHKTRYMAAVRMLGGGDVVGNELDNVFVSGPGDNAFTGGDGVDTVVYCSPREEYTVEGDTVTHPDSGTDKLDGVEVLHFLDGAVER